MCIHAHRRPTRKRAHINTCRCIYKTAPIHIHRCIHTHARTCADAPDAQSKTHTHTPRIPTQSHKHPHLHTHTPFTHTDTTRFCIHSYTFRHPHGYTPATSQVNKRPCVFTHAHPRTRLRLTGGPEQVAETAGWRSQRTHLTYR